MKSLEIYSSTAVSPLLSVSSIVTSSSAEGRMGSVQTASDKTDIPFQLHCIYLKKPLCQVLAVVKDFGSVVEAEIAFKVKIRGLLLKKERNTLTELQRLSDERERIVSLWLSLRFDVSSACRSDLWKWFTLSFRKMCRRRAGDMRVNTVRIHSLALTSLSLQGCPVLHFMLDQSRSIQINGLNKNKGPARII